jgi:hypothetical protein
MSTKEFNEWEFRLNVANRKAEPVLQNVKTNLDYYRGKQWPKNADQDWTHLVVENMIFSNTRTLVSQLAFKNPKHFITPLRNPTPDFDTIAAAMHLESLLGWTFKEMKTLRETRKCLYDALLGHRGIARLGYTLKTEKIKGDDEINVDEIIKADSPFIKRYSEFDFRHDTQGQDALLEDSRWCAFRFVASLQDVKDNPKYTTRGLRSNAKMITDFGEDGTGIKMRMDSDTGEVTELVEGWEIYDKKTRRVRVIVPGHDKFIRNDKWEKALDNIEGLPAEILYLNENPNEALPVSDVNTYRPMQDELNKIRSLQIDHIDKISRRRYVADENKLSDEEMRKITHGGNGAVARSQGSIENALLPVKDAAISQDVYIIANQVKGAIRQMAGLSPAEGLDPTTGPDSATEAGIIGVVASSLRSDQQSQYEDFTVRLSRKLAMILQKTLDKTAIPLNQSQFQEFANRELRGIGQSKLVKIAGAEGAIMLQPWLELSKKDIQGEYLFDVEVGSTQPINEETRKRDYVTLSQTFGQNPWIRQREATRLGLDVFNVPDAENFLKSEEEFSQEAQAQAEAATAGEIEDRRIKSETDLAKTQMKAQSSEKIAGLKATTEMSTTALDNQTERLKTGAKVIADMIRTKGGQQK